MLSSISPVGEHARGQRFGVTATAYLVGSTLGGGALGALLGVLGLPLSALTDDGTRLLLLGVLAVLGLVLDATVGAPSLHRQVDERWLTRYRGWVYGVGFGAQLGTGVVTIIPSSVVHVMWLGAVLVGGPAGGAAVGLAFGAARALPLVASVRVRTVGALRRTLAAVDRLRRPAARTTGVAQMAVAAVAVLASLAV